MNKGFYLKLAASNIKKNSKTNFPYIITCIVTVAMFYIIRSLSVNDGLEKMVGGDTLSYILSLGCWIVAIFAFIFLFYTNSFLIKRRKKEFGVFNILGMEKRHLARVMAFETLYSTVISLVLGLGLGFLLDKVMYLLIAKVVGGEITLGFYISGESIISTIALFCVIFLLIFLNSLRHIHVANPIDLLRSGNVGEKEPKTKWIIAILGILCLAAGYYISLSIKNPLSAISLFFLAVILVMIGTYFIFTAGSIALLKILRKNRHYYYQTKHFISVSGMIYRMKQNAVGLANICVLSTMVLVMVSTTASMMIGLNDIINSHYPYEISIYSDEMDEEKNNQAVERVKDLIYDNQIKLENEVSYTYLVFSVTSDGDTFNADRNLDFSSIEDIANLLFISLEDYNAVTGENKTLKDNEILIYSNSEEYNYSTLNLFDKKYTVVEKVDEFIGNGALAANIASSHFIVVNDMEEIYDIYNYQKEEYGDEASNIRYFYGLDVDEDAEKQIELYDCIQNVLFSQNFSGTIECREEARNSINALYAGLFFLGIFLGTLFVIATILIIYYKQISEGYDDKERFEIMQKVGLSRSEVKHSIHSQILTVFFLPLVMAGIHIAFAFPIILKLLAVFYMLNTGLYIACTSGCFLVFALVYGIIYVLTSKTYYNIVSRK